MEITEAGRCAIAAVDAAIAEVEREAFADLDDADIAQLHALLARIRNRRDDSACGQA